MTLTLITDSRPYPRLRRFAIDLAITAVFNVAIALMVTYVMRISPSFFQNLVVSMCIGTLMVSFIDGGRLLLWGINKPPRWPFLALFLVSIPAARQLGNLIAGNLLDIPPEKISAAMHANPTGSIVLFGLVCLSVTWFFWNRGHMEFLKAEAEAEKARAAAIEKQAMQAQLQMLQAQIEPHMLFNTLANLQGLIALDPPRAQHMLDQLIQYLRATLASSRSERTTLKHEFSLMEAYLDLMKMRMGSRLNFHLQLPEELAQSSVPPMLLQPLAENAIKHGLEPKVEGGSIEVRASAEAGLLKLCVADTGLGDHRSQDVQGKPDSSSSTAGTGVGLSNISDRLHVLYGERASFSLQPNTPCGVVAQITLPL